MEGTRHQKDKCAFGRDPAFQVDGEHRFFTVRARAMEFEVDLRTERKRSAERLVFVGESARKGKPDIHRTNISTGDGVEGKFCEADPERSRVLRGDNAAEVIKEETTR